MHSRSVLLKISAILAVCLFSSAFSGERGGIEFAVSPFALLGGGIAFEGGYELTQKINVGIESGIYGLLFKPDVGGDRLSGLSIGTLTSYNLFTLWKSLEIRAGAGVSYTNFYLENRKYSWRMTGPQLYTELRQKLWKHFVWRGGLGGLLRTNNISDPDLKEWVEETSLGQVIITFDIMVGVVF